MDDQMVKRYYELNEQLKILQAERDILNKELKNFMLKSGINKATVGNYILELRVQDRSKFDNTVVDYLKEIGMDDLIMETYDEKKLKERIKTGHLNTDKLKKYRIENLIHVLRVGPTKPSKP